MKYVAYYRVSTAKQGKSGLGLDAQKETVRNFVESEGDLIGEFVEVQSGGKNSRGELWKAIALARKQEAKIVIARLDRFSRKVSFISGIMDQGVSLIVADMPHANDFQLHIFAALAQEERRLISVRTKAALQQAKMRGTLLGVHGKTLAMKRRKEADVRGQVIRDAIGPQWQALTFSEVKRRLVDLRLEPPRGKDWTVQTIKNLIERPFHDR